MNYYFAVQKANDVLRVTSYLHEPIDKQILDSFFENFGYEYCVGLSCVSNQKELKNKIKYTSKILFSDIIEKEVSITVFYN